MRNKNEEQVLPTIDIISIEKKSYSPNRKHVNESKIKKIDQHPVRVKNCY